MKTKLQIETAEQILNKILTNKKKEIAEKLYEKDIQKYSTEVKSILNKARTLNTETEKLYKKITKNPNLITNTYYLKNNTFKPNKKNLINILKTAIPQNNAQPYLHNLLPKETEEVENFILNLKLGTGLLEDLQELINKIKNIK